MFGALTAGILSLTGLLGWWINVFWSSSLIPEPRNGEEIVQAADKMERQTPAWAVRRLGWPLKCTGTLHFSYLFNGTMLRFFKKKKKKKGKTLTKCFTSLADAFRAEISCAIVNKIKIFMTRVRFTAECKVDALTRIRPFFFCWSPFFF